MFAQQKLKRDKRESIDHSIDQCPDKWKPIWKKHSSRNHVFILQYKKTIPDRLRFKCKFKKLKKYWMKR